MLQSIRELDEKRLLKWLWWGIGIFVAILLLVSYLGGNHDYLSFHTGVWILICAFIPTFLVLVLMYVRADNKTRAKYNIRILLVLALFVIRYGWIHWR